MKKLIFPFFLTLIFTSNLYAQSDSINTIVSIESDISAPTLSIGKGGDRILLNFYTDLWQQADSKTTISSYSPGFDIIAMSNIPFGKSKFGIAFGIGLATHNMRSNAMPADEMVFDTNSNTFVETGNTTFDKIPDNINNKEIEYDINKLTLTYLDIPLELRFKSETKKGKDVKISIGGKVGYLLSSHTKYKGTDLNNPDNDIKLKSYKIKNLSLLRYGAILRVGYDKFSVFGFYSLSNLFKADKGPEMYPVSIGISFTPF